MVGIQSPLVSIYLHEGVSYDPCSDSLGQFTAYSLQPDPCRQHSAVFFLITEKAVRSYWTRDLFIR